MTRSLHMLLMLYIALLQNCNYALRFQHEDMRSLMSKASSGRDTCTIEAAGTTQSRFCTNSNDVIATKSDRGTFYLTDSVNGPKGQNNRGDGNYLEFMTQEEGSGAINNRGCYWVMDSFNVHYGFETQWVTGVDGSGNLFTDPAKDAPSNQLARKMRIRVYCHHGADGNCINDDTWLTETSFTCKLSTVGTGSHSLVKWGPLELSIAEVDRLSSDSATGTAFNDCIGSINTLGTLAAPGSTTANRGFICRTGKSVDLPKRKPETGGIGDPHLTNLAGETFDVLATGKFNFLRLVPATRDAVALNMDANIDRAGGNCKQTYTSGLTLSGTWLQEFQNASSLQIRAVPGVPLAQALEYNLLGRWEKTRKNLNVPNLVMTEKEASILIHSVKIRVFTDSHWGWNYLNVLVDGISDQPWTMRASGLLVNDDFRDVMKTSDECISLMKGERWSLSSFSID